MLLAVLPASASNGLGEPQLQGAAALRRKRHPTVLQRQPPPLGRAAAAEPGSRCCLGKSVKPGHGKARPGRRA